MGVCSGQVLVLEFHLPDVCWDGHLSFLLLYVSQEWSGMTSDAFSGLLPVLATLHPKKNLKKQL